MSLAQITLTNKVKDSDDILLITPGKISKRDAPVQLTAKQVDYVNNRIDGQDQVVTLNLYDRFLFFAPSTDYEEDYKNAEALRKAGSQVEGIVNKHKIEKLVIQEIPEVTNNSLAVAEGAALSNYQFLKYKDNQDEQKHALREIALYGAGAFEKEVQRLNHVIAGTNTARDLVNEPLSYLTAEQLSKEIEMLGDDAGFRVDVFHKKKIEKLGMGGILSVNRGSVTPPTFNILEWKPKKPVNDQPIVLVGKGIVYDTGGLSLKPTNGMDIMKADMGGAATVVGALYAIAKSQLPVHVVGLIPATDNRPGQDAYVPSDVITMYDGSTVEVMNTDAEGRLVLADALTYTKQNYNPSLVLDFATLTGSAARAIGTKGLVYMGNADEHTKTKMTNAGKAVYERLVEFPIWEEYRQNLDSDIADIKNVGGAEAGAIVAGKFLEHFVSFPWLHFDIAGPSFLSRKEGYRPKNGSGVGVRLLYQYLREMSTS
jgi:leucyl aminopeptidase